MPTYAAIMTILAQVVVAGPGNDGLPIRGYYQFEQMDTAAYQADTLDSPHYEIELGA